jgi:DNA-binding NtrC family response regulator
LRLSSANYPKTDPDVSEPLPDPALSSDLARLREIALSVLRALKSFEQMAKPINTKLTLKEQVAEFESRLIRSALMKTGGNQRRAAQLLGIKATALNTKIKRYGIDLVGHVEEDYGEGRLLDVDKSARQ